MKKLTEYIEKAVTDYLENEVEFDLEEMESTEDLIDTIDSRYLAKAIAKALEDRVLQFNATPQIGGRAQMSMTCGSCYRPYGVWISSNGINLTENKITSFCLTSDISIIMVKNEGKTLWKNRKRFKKESNTH